MDFALSQIAVRLLEILAEHESVRSSEFEDRINGNRLDRTYSAAAISSTLLRMKHRGFVDVEIVQAFARDGALRGTNSYRISDRGRNVLRAYTRNARSKSAALLSGSERYYEMLVS